MLFGLLSQRNLILVFIFILFILTPQHFYFIIPLIKTNSFYNRCRNNVINVASSKNYYLSRYK